MNLWWHFMKMKHRKNKSMTIPGISKKRSRTGAFSRSLSRFPSSLFARRYAQSPKMRWRGRKTTGCPAHSVITTLWSTAMAAMIPPELAYDEHFTMSLPWRLQIWVRGSNDSIAVRGLHEQPILSGGFLQTPMSPSKQCESWMREHGHPTSGFVGSAQFLVTHSLDTTVIWRLDRLWRVAAAAGGCKQDPPKPLHVRQTNESRSCRNAEPSSG